MLTLHCAFDPVVGDAEHCEGAVTNRSATDRRFSVADQTWRRYSTVTHKHNLVVIFILREPGDRLPLRLGWPCPIFFPRCCTSRWILIRSAMLRALAEATQQRASGRGRHRPQLSEAQSRQPVSSLRRDKSIRYTSIARSTRVLSNEAILRQRNPPSQRARSASWIQSPQHPPSPSCRAPPHRYPTPPHHRSRSRGPAGASYDQLRPRTAGFPLPRALDPLPLDRALVPRGRRGRPGPQAAPGHAPAGHPPGAVARRGGRVEGHGGQVPAQVPSLGTGTGTLATTAPGPPVLQHSHAGHLLAADHAALWTRPASYPCFLFSPRTCPAGARP